MCTNDNPIDTSVNNLAIQQFTIALAILNFHIEPFSIPSPP